MREKEDGFETIEEPGAIQRGPHRPDPLRSLLRIDRFGTEDPFMPDPIDVSSRIETSPSNPSQGPLWKRNPSVVLWKVPIASIAEDPGPWRIPIGARRIRNDSHHTHPER